LYTHKGHCRGNGIDIYFSRGPRKNPFERGPRAINSLVSATQIIRITLRSCATHMHAHIRAYNDSATYYYDSYVLGEWRVRIIRGAHFTPLRLAQPPRSECSGVGADDSRHSVHARQASILNCKAIIIIINIINITIIIIRTRRAARCSHAFVVYVAFSGAQYLCAQCVSGTTISTPLLIFFDVPLRYFRTITLSFRFVSTRPSFYVRYFIFLILSSPLSCPDNASHP
jgi:hypothetical protein